MTSQNTKLPKIILGYRVGKLEVTAPTDIRKSNYIVWRCKCSCGREILLDTRTLRRGTVTSCGCDARVTPGQKDLTGMRFGHLVGLEPIDQRSKSGSTIWRCKCDCGNECLAASTQLTQGYKKAVVV